MAKCRTSGIRTVHDHRRPQEHGRGHRPRARLLWRRVAGPDRRGARRPHRRGPRRGRSRTWPSTPGSRPSTSSGPCGPGAGAATSRP
ncbi:MAG: hypothetical protein M0C28_35835 [Candidatus Moduliflexus flocculans]|nr:hypothetical protein [Candidatus Moduliflexus flocculans]